MVVDAAFADLDPGGDGAVQHVDALLEPFEQPDAGIVAREDPGRRRELDEQLPDVRQQPIGRLRERLQHEVVAVPIDDERRQQIGFAVHEPVRRRVDGQRVPKADGLRQPRPPGVERRRLRLPA